MTESQLSFSKVKVIILTATQSSNPVWIYLKDKCMVIKFRSYDLCQADCPYLNISPCFSVRACEFCMFYVSATWKLAPMVLSKYNHIPCKFSERYAVGSYTESAVVYGM